MEGFTFVWILTVSIISCPFLSPSLYRPNGKINSMYGVAEVKDPSQPALLSLSLSRGEHTGDVIEQACFTITIQYRASSPGLFYTFYPYLYPGIPDSPYWIISTDYQTYCLVYSCMEYFGLFHFDFAWILARTRELDPDVLSQLRGTLAAAGVNVTRLTVSDQTGCDVMAWGAIEKLLA